MQLWCDVYLVIHLTSAMDLNENVRLSYVKFKQSNNKFLPSLETHSTIAGIAHLFILFQ